MQKFHTVCACLLLLTGIALAQAAKPEPKTVSQVLNGSVTNVENELVPAADAMPTSPMVVSVRYTYVSMTSVVG